MKEPTMEDIKQTFDGKERDILFSKTIKAGQRIYYVDVKQNRKEEMYLSITESKKIVSGDAEAPQVSYEKHKIFIYHEDFAKFRESLEEAMRFIEEKEGTANRTEINDDEIKIDLEF